MLNNKREDNIMKHKIIMIAFAISSLSVNATTQDPSESTHLFNSEAFSQIWESGIEASADAWQDEKKNSIELWDLSKEKTSEVWQESKDSSKEIWNSSKEKSADAWAEGKDSGLELWEDVKSESKGAWGDGVDLFNDLLDDESVPKNDNNDEI